jgi:uncharacterized hydrophobic protein (TIGR00271 family)
MTIDTNVEAGREAIHQGAAFDRPFMLRNLAATVLASAGLLGNSATTIIGAMLVASLTGPVMGIGLALVDSDNRLLRRSLFTLLGGALLVLATSAAIGRVVPDITPTEEMLMLTSPRLLDLVVALVGGAISAYAAASPRLSSALVGIAIAVTLVPPLATAAILGSQAHWALARGAFLMAFVNMVAIQVGASASLWLCGYRSSAQRVGASLGAVLRREKLSLLVVLGLVVTLAVHGLRLINEQRYEASVRDVLGAAIAQRPEARLIEVLFSTGEDGRASVTAVVRSPARFASAEVGAMARSLPAAPDGSMPQLQLRHVEVDVVAAGN